MKIAQLILSEASHYERKSQVLDANGLEALGHTVVLSTRDEVAWTGADVVHVYGPPILPRALFIGFPLPYVASGTIEERRFALRRAVAPSHVISPLAGVEGTEVVPEAVDESILGRPRRESARADIRAVGVFDPSRPGVESLIERTRHRLERTRDDVRFVMFDGDPRDVDFSRCDVWVDPATENDFDGLTAEAVASGLVVVAARTPINQLRLEQGRTGFLVPPGDPNELSHAILTALFKPEAAEQKLQSARQTIAKWKARHRLRALLSLYESLIR